MHVDGHEKAEQRFKKYFTELEPHMHRWVQVTSTLTKEEARDMVNSGDMDKLLDTSTKRKMMKNKLSSMHVDTNDFLHKYASNMYLFGGMPSVRRDRE
jgi:hypothetical protein